MNDIEQLKTKFYIFEKSNLYKKSKRLVTDKINNKYENIDINDMDDEKLYTAFIDSFLNYNDLSENDIKELISYIRMNIIRVTFAHRINIDTMERYITLDIILNQSSKCSAILFHYHISNKDFLQLQAILLKYKITYSIVNIDKCLRTKAENNMDFQVTLIINQIFHTNSLEIERTWMKNFPENFDGDLEDYLGMEDDEEEEDE